LNWKGLACCEGLMLIMATGSAVEVDAEADEDESDEELLEEEDEVESVLLDLQVDKFAFLTEASS